MTPIVAVRAPLLCSLLLAAAPFAPARAAPGGDDKIDPHLLRRLRAGPASFLVVLADQADPRPAAALADPDARGWAVFRSLKDHADRTQSGVLAVLSRHGAPHRRFWVANVIQAEGDLPLVRLLSARPDVRAIEGNPEVPGIEPPGLANLVPDPGRPAPEWGVRAIRADAVWDLGFTGQGMVVANADTGVQWDHPALLANYRGWDGATARHDSSWHDAIHDGTGNPCGADAVAPCDDNGHGTHTTGTSVGDDGMDNRVGVAPGARWIACRNMDRGAGTPARYTECFQFFLAPTDLRDQHPDPDLRPHVINNSWGCPRSEGCAALTLQLVVENVQAAGILVEVSAGNSGPNCGTVSDPPALYDAVLSTGAIDSMGRLAGFSSRGAFVQDGGPARLKPDLVAPGVNVRSSLPGGRYGQSSGTSMAGPHATGAVALLWSARPDLLRQVDATREVLRRSASPVVDLLPQTCAGLTSDFIPNHSFGYGRLDVLAAVTY